MGGLTHNRYLINGYNDDPNQIIRTDVYDKWKVTINVPQHIGTPKKTFKEEVLHTCELVYDQFKSITPKLNFFFSGGIDSECGLRCFHELKIPIKPIIFRHKYAPLAAEFVDAVQICKSLGLSPTVIDVDLATLFKNGKLLELGVKYQTTRLGIVEMMHALELVGEPAVVLDQLHLEYKCSNKDLLCPNEPPTWQYCWQEDQDGIYERFMRLSGIPVVNDFFCYTPESWAAMLLTEAVKNIVFFNRNKASSLSTKNLMMSMEFDIRWRRKTGIFHLPPYKQIARMFYTSTRNIIPLQKEILIGYFDLLDHLGVDYKK